MADDKRRERARALLDAMGVSYGQTFPLHVLFRMALFVDGDDVVYAGVRITPDEERHRSFVREARPWPSPQPG